MTSRLDKPRILSVLATYWPGNEATGPVQSLRAFVSGMRDQYNISILASDVADQSPKGWHAGDIAPFAQLRQGRFGAEGLLSILRKTPHDVLMLNSFHDPQFVVPILTFRKLGLIPCKPTILSPRGEFAPSALSFKSRKKATYMRAVRLTGLTRTVWFHATANHERHDIEATGLACNGILEAQNLRVLPELPTTERSFVSSHLRIAFLGRISPVKNLDFALRVLSKVSVPVTFDIFGPKQDPNYWAKLQKQIALSPEHVRVNAKGTLAHDQVATTLAKYDLFFLPTLGENFGHAINEALASGVPVLISDATPWRDLKLAGAGWDLPLDVPDAFVEVIETFASATPETRAQARRAARALAERSFAESDALEANRRMLQHVLNEERTRA